MSPISLLPPTPRIFRPSYGLEVSFQFVTSRKKLVEDFLKEVQYSLPSLASEMLTDILEGKKSTLYQITYF